MPFYKVRVGQVLGHSGVDLHEGAVLELNVAVGREVAEKCEPCTADGVSLAHLSLEALEVAQQSAHARESVIERQIRELEAKLADAQARLADEQSLHVESHSVESEDAVSGRRKK